MHLSTGQLNRISEILGNLAVAWFSGGIISPLLSKSQDFIEIIKLVLFGLLMAVIFSIVSTALVKNIKL